MRQKLEKNHNTCSRDILWKTLLTYKNHRLHPIENNHDWNFFAQALEGSGWAQTPTLP